MQARIVTTTEEFAELRSAWNRLAQRCAAEPFALWDWAFTAHETLHSDSADLFIIALEEGDELLALAPLCIRRAGLGPLRGRAVRLIGDEHADYGSFLLAPEHNQHDLLKRLLAVLFEHRDRWDVLHLLNFSSRNPQTHLIAEVAAAEHGVATAYGERIVTPYCSLRDGPPKLVSKEARNLRRRERNLARDHEVDISVGIAFDEESWNALLDFHLARWPASIFLRESNRLFFRGLVSRLEASGNLELSQLRVDGAIAALHFGFRTTRKVAYYIPVYDPRFARDGVGGILLKHIIDHYAGTVDEFDFLRGNEPYKFSWTGEVTVNENLLVDNGRCFGRILVGALELKDNLRRIAWLRKITDRIKNLPHPRPTPSPAPRPRSANPARVSPAEEPVTG